MRFKLFRDIFTFTRIEKNGILMLLALMLLIVIMNFSMSAFINEKRIDLSEWESRVDSFYLSFPTKSIDSIMPHPFYPNKITFNKLVSMGMPQRVAGNWVSYVKAGGRFNSPEDTKKIYGITPEIFSQIEKYMIFQDSREVRIVRNTNDTNNVIVHVDSRIKKYVTKFVKKEPHIVEINSADSVVLEALPGLGGVLSARIIKFRELLGGFYSVEQLKEVYGLKDEYLSKALPYIELDKDKISKMRINYFSKRELAMHPYISYGIANSIVETRDKKGKLIGIQELSGFLSENEIEKLGPYLSFD
jgi:DNA uptake protein ComE-like DNA-binding protein